MHDREYPVFLFQFFFVMMTYHYHSFLVQTSSGARSRLDRRLKSRENIDG